MNNTYNVISRCKIGSSFNNSIPKRDTSKKVLQDHECNKIDYNTLNRVAKKYNKI